MKLIRKLFRKIERKRPKEPIIWWKDVKLLFGIFLMIASIAFGFYGKGLLGIFFVNLLKNLYRPFYLLTGLSVYAASWILLFIGISMVGWETVRIMQSKIKHKVKRTVKKTYKHAKRLHKKSYDYTKKIHNDSIDKIAKMSKKEHDSINIK